MYKDVKYNLNIIFSNFHTVITTYNYMSRSLDVLGVTTTDSTLHVDDRRRSSFSPRRISGDSSVSGITFFNL